MKDDLADLKCGTRTLLADVDRAARKLGYKDFEDMRRSRRERIAKGIYTPAYRSQREGPNKEGAKC